MILEHLRAAGYEVDSLCVDTESAFIAALDQSFDIILSDHTLPQYGGREALEAVKARAIEIPFILVSGRVGEQAAVGFIKAGAADYVPKQSLASLGATVASAMAQQQLRLDRRRALDSALKSEAKFRSYVDNAPVAIFVADRAWRIIDFNRAALDLMGCDAPTLSQMTTIDLHPIEDRRTVFLAHQELAAKGRFEGEAAVLRRDGRRVWVLLRAVMLDKERSIAFLQDITERKLAAAERQALEAQYRQAQKMEAIGRLAGGVAHDFNNMLAVIQGYSSALLTDGDLNRQQTDSLVEITRAAERAAALTRQLLLFSRKQIIEVVNLDINEAVDGVARMLQRILGEDVTLEMRLEANLPMVSADVGMIEQALLNLIVNSRDAMPRGGKLLITTAALSLDLKRAEQVADAIPGPCVRLSIADTGSGIPPEVLPRIFEPFFTTKEVGKGTGLGLATVHGIVKQHRGWITVESEVGRGTTFHLHFPAAAAGRPKARAARTPEKAPTGAETILLVEDEQPLRMLVANLLERCGYTVLSAESAKAGLALWEDNRERIALLLTDIVMPDGLTGLELGARLTAQNPGLKVIYTSGYAAEPGKNVSLIEGVNFLQKPCHPLKLAQVVRARLDSLDLAPQTAHS